MRSLEKMHPDAEKAATARPASDGRAFGKERGTTARKCGSQKPSTLPSFRLRNEYKAGVPGMEINTHTLMLIALAMAASGGFVHVLISPYLSGEAKAPIRHSGRSFQAELRTYWRCCGAP